MKVDKYGVPLLIQDIDIFPRLNEIRVSLFDGTDTVLRLQDFFEVMTPAVTGMTELQWMEVENKVTHYMQDNWKEIYEKKQRCAVTKGNINPGFR